MTTRAETTLHVIGNPPVVRLQRIVPPGCADVFVKREYINPTGSYKDRMALALVEEAERRATSDRTYAWSSTPVGAVARRWPLSVP